MATITTQKYQTLNRASVSGLPQDLNWTPGCIFCTALITFSSTVLDTVICSRAVLGSLTVKGKLQPCCNLRLNDLMPKTLSWMMAQQLGHFTGMCVSLLSALSRLRIVSQSRFQHKLLVLLVVGLFTVGSQTLGHWPPVCLHLFMLEKYQHTRRNRAKGSNSGATEMPRPRRVAGAPGNSVVSRLTVKMPAPERRRRSKPASPGLTSANPLPARGQRSHLPSPLGAKSQRKYVKSALKQPWLTSPRPC